MDQNMRRIFFFTLFTYLAVTLFFSYQHQEKKQCPIEEELVVVNQAVQTQITEIDQQLEELKRMKMGYLSRARRHEDQAERLQFQDQAVLETRRHLQLAEENRMKADRIQEEIDRLEKEKTKLLGTS